MQVRVIVLRRNGLRLTRGEWSEPVAGDLRITGVAADQTSYKRCVRMAELWEVGGQWERPVLKPLADPQILRTVEGGFLLAGLELEPQGERIAEHHQVWLCVPVLGDAMKT